jgi:hypothetical protein
LELDAWYGNRAGLRLSTISHFGRLLALQLGAIHGLLVEVRGFVLKIF